MEDFESYFEALKFHFTNWNDILENENIDISNNNTCEIVEKSVQLLPRQDVSLYGIIPKMERRSFSSCKQCKHVFNPRDVLLHKNCTLKVKSQYVTHLKKNVKTKKNPPLPLPPLFSTGLEGVSPLEGLNTTELRPNSIYIVNASELPEITADANPTLAEPSPHPDAVGSFPLPPSTLSSPKEQSPSSENTVFMNSVDKVSSANTSSIVNVVGDPKGPRTRSIKYSNHSSIIQDGEMVCLDDMQQVLTPSDCPQQVYFTIPEQLNVKMYKTRPKLASIPLYGARKIGGTFVISKQKLISFKSTSLLNNPHGLNILKSKNNKLILRKTATDKNIKDDVKHIRLSSDVNGFIIHADVSESSEEPQNSIHDGKISLMNIK